MKKISLCLIVGNVEEYIERCLNSFKAIADEIIVVRAIGNQTPDRTLEIAKHKFGAVTGEYRNSPEKSDWPHVDNFAAARQMSFDLASCEYCFWCDTDDVLEPGSAELIREHAERGGYPLFLFPYNIFGRGVRLPRERMILRGAGKWRFPVHECFEFSLPVEGVQDDRVVITHLPHFSKSGSNERNLKILQAIPEAQMSAGLWYHLYGALGSAGRVQEAVEAAKRAIAHPDIGVPEKYELFLDLARMAKNPKVKAKFLHEAHQTDPKRREALAILAGNALDYGHNADALALARQMMATEKPAGESWNDRHAAYGPLGLDIYCQALRMNGHEAKAEEIRQRALEDSGGPTIALVHATKGRPQQASQCRKQWIDFAAEPDRIEHIFVFDDDDEASLPLRRMHHLQIKAGGGCVAAWNNGAIATRAPVIVQLSDDWSPVPQWDKIILEKLGDLSQPKVLAISDGSRKDDLLCMAICTRAYFDQDNFLFHPWFTGVYSDNWFTQEAYRRGQVVEARDIVFAHHHPAFGSAQADDTYCLQNAPERYAQGKKTINQLSLRNDWSTVPGFFNYWTFYQSIAQKLVPGETFVEVGSWMGRSIIYLAQELQRLGKVGVRLIAVDCFTGEAGQLAHAEVVNKNGGNIRAAFEANLKRCGVSDMVEIIESDSAAAASRFGSGELSGCFIDAAHDYVSVRRDVQAWRSKVKTGGLLAGHDAQHDPVKNAVSELLPTAKFMGCLWVNL